MVEPRPATPTVAFVDEYCQFYESLFPEVRSFEAFKLLHLGMIREVGDLYGLRTWVEYGIKQSKSELGWADFRLTKYAQIEKWWEVVISAFLLVSLYSEQLTGPASNASKQLIDHPIWNSQSGWKNWLNNLRLMIQPFVCFSLIKPWLLVFANSRLSLGFPRLIEQMNSFHLPRILTGNELTFQFSSA